MINSQSKFAIIGLGLIGGSYAMALKLKGFYVIGIDSDSCAVDYALEHEYINEGGNDYTLLKKADIIISALYPLTMIEYFKNAQDWISDGTIISDVSGVKSNIISEVQAIFGSRCEFISSHPMAGKAESKIYHSDPAIFKQANFIIVPTDKNTPHAIMMMEEMANILEFKNINILGIEEHDQMIAFLSQLTHAIAVSLMNTKDNQHLVEYTGDSFRDLTRIANINEDLWSELFLLNKKALISEIVDFSESLNNLKLMLENNDDKGLKKLFVQAKKRRKWFDKKE